MTDDFEPRVQSWLRERGTVDAETLESVAGQIAFLPAQRTSRPRSPWLAAAVAAVLVVAVGIGIAVAPRISGGPSPLPPDPAAFAGDPRVMACFGGAGEVQYAFEMAHARDYQRHLPNMLLSPELDVDAPAFVVVFAPGVVPNVGVLGGPGASGPQTAPPPSHRSVCILVADAPNLYSDVDIDGLRATVEPIDAPAASPTASIGEAPASPTIQPAPSWVADLTGQLECDGAIADIGGEPDDFGAGQGPTATDPDAALQGLLDQGDFASFPARGFEPAVVDGHWARHDYLVDGRRKALAVTSDQIVGLPTDIGWQVAGIRACDASEFDPADGLTFAQTLWLAANGAVARSDTIHSSPGPEHCGWESAIFLRFEGDQYIRDPLGVLADHTLEPFDLDATLPEGAVDSGYNTPGWHLFTVSPGDAVYVRTTDGTFERWGRLREEIGCA